MYDVLIKNARLIDPSQSRDGIFDIAIAHGKVAAINHEISVESADIVYPLSGQIIVPGLIDAHCHPVGTFTDHAVPADEAGVDAGVLLVNDAGSSGSANFLVLQDLLQNAETTITFFLNFASCGLIKLPEIASVHDFNIAELKKVVSKAGTKIRGIKIRAMESVSKIPIDVIALAKKTAVELDLPLMVHIGEFRNRKENDPFDSYSRKVVSLLDKGDILSHYMSWRPGGMVTEDGAIYAELAEAKSRGVILDCSHGRNNFSFKVANTLLHAGYIPDIITTDLSSLGRTHVQSLLVTMSKFLALGMPLMQVIEAVTINAAKALTLENSWGSLEVGRAANITVLEMIKGHFEFFDGTAGNKISGETLIEPRLIFMNGVPRSCRSYYHVPAVGRNAISL